MNVNGVQHMTNHMYVGEVCPSFSQKSFLNFVVCSGGSLVIHSDRLGSIPGLNTSPAELYLGLKKICASGWSSLLIQRIDSTT
jgi:hypothetical protein